MITVISHISDTELNQELVHDIRERYIEQKLLYIDREGAERYYELHHKNKSGLQNQFSDNDYYEFLSKNLPQERVKTAVVSLGCGNAERERGTIEKLIANGYEVIYIGIDASTHMLNMAEEQLAHIDIEKYYVKTDITSKDFKDEVIKLTKDCDMRIFTFLGGTIGNVNQTNIADVLYDLLNDQDILWLDTVIRADLSMERNLRIFNRYSSYINDEKIMEYFFHPLAHVGVPYESGQMHLKTQEETSVGALMFTFYFHINKKTVLNIKGETIHLLPNEEIKLINIRVYHPETLISFFAGHEFKLKDFMKKENKAQYIFKK
jgi:hypothetical protein